MTKAHEVLEAGTDDTRADSSSYIGVQVQVALLVEVGHRGETLSKAEANEVFVWRLHEALVQEVLVFLVLAVEVAVESIGVDGEAG